MTARPRSRTLVSRARAGVYHGTSPAVPAPRYRVSVARRLPDDLPDAACPVCGFEVPARRVTAAPAPHRVVPGTRPARDGWPCPGGMELPQTPRPGPAAGARTRTLIDTKEQPNA